MIRIATPGRRAALGLTALFAALAFNGLAHAGQVLAESGVFIGNSAAQYSLTVTGAGSLNAYLNDYKFTSPISDLTLEIASQGKILGRLTGAGHETVTLAGPGTYYAFVVGNATGSLDIGAFGLTADFEATPPPTPVPLPGSFWLLLGGIAATAWSMRRTART